MHVMRGRPEAAERHGAGHVARCTVERLMGVLGLRGVRRARSPRTTRSAPREQCPADLVKRHFNAFRPNELWVADVPPQAEVLPPMYAPSRGGSTSPSSPTCTPGGSSAGRPPVGQCAPTLPWTPWRWPSGSGNVRGADLSGLVHHLRPRRAVQVHPPRGCPVRVRGDRLGGVDGRLLLALPWPRL